MAKFDYNSSNFRNSTIDRLNGKFGKGDENRGDRMAARGRKMMAHADVKLEKRLESEAKKTSSKSDKLSSKYGETPKLGQYNRLKSAKDKAGTAQKKVNDYKLAKDFQDMPESNPNYKSMKGNEQFKWTKEQNSSEALKYQRGQTKVKKGEMLSKHINAKKK